MRKTPDCDENVWPQMQKQLQSSWESFLWDLDIIWLECTPLFPVCNYKHHMSRDVRFTN